MSNFSCDLLLSFAPLQLQNFCCNGQARRTTSVGFHVTLIGADWQQVASSLTVMSRCPLYEVSSVPDRGCEVKLTGLSLLRPVLIHSWVRTTVLMCFHKPLSQKKQFIITKQEDHITWLLR